MKRFFAASVCVVFWSQAAVAATLAGNFSGTIGTPQGATSDIVFTGAGTNTLSWGVPDWQATDVQPDNSSLLRVNNGDFGPVEVEDGDTLLLGTIEWNNQSNWKTGSYWNSRIELELNFTEPTAVGPFNDFITFWIKNTPDASYNTDTNEETGLNPDGIGGIKLNSDFGVPIDLGERTKLTSITFGLFDAGDPGTHKYYYDEHGQKVGSALYTYTKNDEEYIKWVNREGGHSVLGIYGHVEIAPIPLPAGAVLLLTGIGAFAVARRRTTDKTKSA